MVKFKPTVVGDENEFTKALQNQQIVHSTVEDIINVLKLVMLKVGIREKNLPSQEEKQVLIDHILTNYGNHTPQEIKLAFDMGMAGKLEDLNNKQEPIDLEMNCYGDFTCIYFSKVMNAYRRWARQTHNQLKMQQVSEIKEPEETTPEEMIDWIEDWRKKEDINLNLIPLCFYDFLLTTQMITISTEQKWESLGKAVQSIKTDLHTEIGVCKTTDALREFGEFEKMEQEGFSGKFKTLIQNRAKRIIVLDYLKK